jgi:hypothetical protein
VTDYIWPTRLTPNASEWRLVANTASFISPLSGTTRTLARGGDRWACTLTFNNLQNNDRALLQSFLSQLRGQANRCYLWDHSYVQRGAFATRNLVPDFSSYTPWTAQYAAVVLTDNIARIQAQTHTGVQNPWLYMTTNATVTSGLPYAVRCLFERSSTGTASMSPYSSDGSTASATYSTAAGLRTLAKTMASTSASFAVVIDGTGTSTVAGDYAVVPYVSMSRCMLVNGASQAGSVLYVTGTLTDADLLPGDRIEVGGEYHMVAEAMWASAGSGSIRLTRPLRSSPTNGSAVVVHQPLCKMLLADQTVGWSNQPGQFSSFSVSFIEDIA